MRPLPPIRTADLFPPLHRAELLNGLGPDDSARPTIDGDPEIPAPIFRARSVMV